MFRNIIIYIALLLIALNALGQGKDVDSLIRNLESYNDSDTLKIDEIVKIVSKLKRRDNEKAIVYLEQGYELCNKLSYLKGKADLLIREGDIYIDKANYKKASVKLNQALTIARKIKNDDLIASTLDYLGTISFYKGNFDESLRLLGMSMELRGKIGDSSNIVHDNIKIGMIYGAQEQYDKALEYFFYADQKEKVESKKVELYYDIGLAYYFKGELNNSVKYFFKSMKLSKMYGPKDIYSFSVTYLGKNYEELGMFDKALKYHFISLMQFEEEGDNLGVLTAKMNIGKCYHEIGNASKAIQFLKEAVELAELTEHQNEQALSSQMLSEILEEEGDFMKALQYHKKSTSIEDSILTKNARSELRELQTKYDTEKKEAQIQYLDQQNKTKEEQLKASRYQIILIVSFTVFIVFILIILYWYNRLKSMQKTAKVEQKLLRVQMNPHFIFNSLAAIQSFVLEKQSNVASRYLADFSNLMRGMLECSATEYISLEQEVEIIENYLNLNTMLSIENTFRYEIEVSPEIDSFSVFIPPMLTQPFIENAIKHGISTLNDQGCILVKFTQSGKNMLKVEIEDNGIGIEQSLKQKRKTTQSHKSMAIEITKDRLKLLNNWGRKKIKLNIVDLKPQGKQGTRVSFMVPFIYN